MYHTKARLFKYQMNWGWSLHILVLHGSIWDVQRIVIISR